MGKGQELRTLVKNNATYAVMERSIGFAMLWHNLGGDEGLTARGISRSTLYARKAEFRRLYGFDVEKFIPTSAYNDAKNATHV